jgi:hypothetical protein
MKKWIPILLGMVLFLPSRIQTRVLQDIPPLAQQISEKMQLAIQNYKEDKVPEGATLLCDVVLMTRPRTSWPEGFVGAVDSAKKTFQKGQFSEGIGYIKQAITIFRPEYPTFAEEGSRSPANIAKLILNKIESAIENLKAGDADQAVILILESLTLLSPAY